MPPEPTFVLSVNHEGEPDHILQRALRHDRARVDGVPLGRPGGRRLAVARRQGGHPARGQASAPGPAALAHGGPGVRGRATARRVDPVGARDRSCTGGWTLTLLPAGTCWHPSEDAPAELPVREAFKMLWNMGTIYDVQES